MVSLSQILMQQGYLTQEQYNYACQLQQSQPIEVRLPLVQIYLEQGFLGVEHIEYCVGLKQQYLAEGTTLDMPQAQQQPNLEKEAANTAPVASVVTCKVCLSECQSDWAMCPFCGNAVS